MIIVSSHLFQGYLDLCLFSESLPSLTRAINALHMLNYLTIIKPLWHRWFCCPCMHAKSLQSCLTLVTLWTHQAPLSMWFSRQEYWSGLHVLLQGIFPTQESNLHVLCLLHCQACSLPLVPARKPFVILILRSMTWCTEKLLNKVRMYSYWITHPGLGPLSNRTHIYLFIYLTVPRLSWDMWDLVP